MPRARTTALVRSKAQRAATELMIQIQQLPRAPPQATKSHQSWCWAGPAAGGALPWAAPALGLGLPRPQPGSRQLMSPKRVLATGATGRARQPRQASIYAPCSAPAALAPSGKICRASPLRLSRRRPALSIPQRLHRCDLEPRRHTQTRSTQGMLAKRRSRLLTCSRLPGGCTPLHLMTPGAKGCV
jgi:hypothetical protein